MKTRTQSQLQALLMGGAAAVALMSANAAWAQDDRRLAFDIPQQEGAQALNQFAAQAGVQIVFPYASVRGRQAPAVQGDYTRDEALRQLTLALGLEVTAEKEGVISLRDPLAQGQGGSGAAGDVDALIVTAQKREENIQDVPIAISAFSQEDLTRSQVAGGPDLMTQIPNFTFTKTNFSGYSIQIRGIGTQAISATTDPAVAVAFNNTPFVRNRFFEQEFYDLERVEVLRGPQGTLYGRNATAGVVNIISAKPKFAYQAKASADIGNYRAIRAEGMVNIPLIPDVAALRIAGAWTKRDGYATNQITGNPIDGRDLWSTRVSLRFEPTEAISANLIWEHFQEDDDRLRSGKQLCKKDPSKTSLNGVAFPSENNPGENASPVGVYNQGCLPASLYAPESFQTPNGFALPYYQPLSQLNLPTVPGLDPYSSKVQSRDLRVVESLVDPAYHARTDTTELQLSFDLGHDLTLASETAYSADELFSTQDYNRFNTAPGAFDQARYYTPARLANARQNLFNSNGDFCDPQIGCTNRLVALDLSTADSRHFSQEFRLSSDFDGKFNFSFGANFLRYDTEDKYYVFINTVSFITAQLQTLNSKSWAYGPYEPGVSDGTDSYCLPYLQGNPNEVQGYSCGYMDPNPIGALNDQGHNYFLSKNPYRLISYAAFGEAYYNVTDNLKVTAGLRWTVDKKHAPQIPSWLLADQTVGYPVKSIVDTEWSEPTGRLTIDWKPDLSFTDETLLYGSYAHGYKAGGANPPPMVVVAGQLKKATGVVESVVHPATFDAEFVDAFEVGSKNTLLDGRLTLNASAFYYDYTGYQISQIIDRTAINSNFDADVWGLELETDWRPTDNLRFGLKLGYEHTKVADGSQAVDVMDRTDGRSDWVVAKPFPSLPSNCILPVSLVTFKNRINTIPNPGSLGGDIGFCVRAYIMGVDPVTSLDYVANPSVMVIGGNNVSVATSNGGYWAGYPGFDPDSAPNNGEGFFKNLSGNELPNAPHYTGSLMTEYTLPLRGDWAVDLHADLYYQSESWARIFNTPGYDKLKAYTNLNLSAIFTNEPAGWTVMAYIKNVMDRDSITGAFLNSDDSGLTTNVFLTEPRLYGLRVTKAFSDVPLLGGLIGERRERPLDEPYRFTLEVGGGVNRLEPETDTFAPRWLSVYLPGADGYPLYPQQHDLDWGDQREARLTYAFGPWRVTAGAREGVAKGEAYGQDSEYGNACGLIFLGMPFCTANPPLNWGSETVHDREEYTVGDAGFGRAFRFGGVSSVLSVGVRYAELKSASLIEDRSNPDHNYIAGTDLLTYVYHWHNYDDELHADRSFKGTGPIASWEGSSALLGGPSTGHIDLDFGLSGGLLYGRQKVSVVDYTRSVELTTQSGVAGSPVVVDAVDVIRQESRSVEVPTFGATLGLSYSLDWMKISGGYRWERYLDAIDGGFNTANDFDRTIDGPYLKLSIGFGG